MAHRLSRTARGRSIRKADVRVGKHRGGTMNMATLRPKPRGQATITAPSRARGGTDVECIGVTCPKGEFCYGGLCHAVIWD